MTPITDVRIDSTISLQSLLDNCKQGIYLANNTSLKSLGRVESFFRWLFGWLPRIDSIRTKCLRQTFTIIRDSGNNHLYQQIKKMNELAIIKGGDLYVISNLIEECWKRYKEPKIKKEPSLRESPQKHKPIDQSPLKKDSAPIVINTPRGSLSIPSPKFNVPLTPSTQKTKLNAFTFAKKMPTADKTPKQTVEQPKLTEKNSTKNTPKSSENLSLSGRMSPLILDSIVTKEVAFCDGLLKKIDDILNIEDPKNRHEKILIEIQICKKEQENYTETSHSKELIYLESDLKWIAEWTQELNNLTEQKKSNAWSINNVKGIKQRLKDSYKTLRKGIALDEIASTTKVTVVEPKKIKKSVKEKFFSLFKKNKSLDKPTVQTSLKPKITEIEKEKVKFADKESEKKESEIKDLEKSLAEINAKIELVKNKSSVSGSLKIAKKLESFRSEFDQLKSKEAIDSSTWILLRDQCDQFQTKLVKDEKINPLISQNLKDEISDFYKLQNTVGEVISQLNVGKKKVS